MLLPFRSFMLQVTMLSLGYHIYSDDKKVVIELMLFLEFYKKGSLGFNVFLK